MWVVVRDPKVTGDERNGDDARRPRRSSKGPSIYGELGCVRATYVKLDSPSTRGYQR